MTGVGNFGAIAAVGTVREMSTSRGVQHGIRAPRRAASACALMIPVSALSGIVGMAALWPSRTNGSEDQPGQAGMAIVVLALGIVTAVGFWLASVVFDWMAAVYQRDKATEVGASVQ